MTAVNSINSGLFASAFAKQSINNTEKSNVDSNSQVASSGENSSATSSAATSFLGAITPSWQKVAGVQNKESSTVNAVGLNTSYKNSALFADKTDGINKNIKVGDSQYVDGGIGRTLCIA